MVAEVGFAAAPLNEAPGKSPPSVFSETNACKVLNIGHVGTPLSYPIPSYLSNSAYILALDDGKFISGNIYTAEV